MENNQTRKNVEKELNKEIHSQEIELEKKENLESAKFSSNHNFLGTIFHFYGKFKFYGLTLMFLIMATVLLSIVTPLITYQMTTDVSISAIPSQSKLTPGSAEAIQAQEIFKKLLPIAYWGMHWKILLLIGLGAVICQCIIMFISQYLQIIVGKKIEIELRNKSLVALIKQDISYYSDKKIGELITKIVSDTQIVGDQCAQVPVQMAQAILQVIAGTIMMFMFDTYISAATISTFFIVLTLTILFFIIIKKRIDNVRRVVTDVNGIVTDKINTVRLIKSNGTELYEQEQFKKENKRYFNAVKKQGSSQALMITTLIGGLSIMQFVSIGTAMMLHAGKNDAFFSTTFTAYQIAANVVMSPLFQVVMATVGIAQATVSVKRVYRIIDLKPIINLHYEDGDELKELKGSIVFKDIEFAYPEKPEQVILPNFNFTFEEGKSYAFVGETGSGKSTIAKLMLRFYDPTKGDVLLNDGKVNLKDIKLKTFLDHVGYVEQEPQILFGDVYDNVRYSKFDATKEEVIKACKLAELDELIKTWPEGYNTVLGERGMLLSGGQKQRLVIARMFLKDPKLLILDEATSALDNIVEKEIQEKLEDLMKGRTTISIAHRLSTIKNADQIIVLAPNIGVVETGRFNELIKKPGHFKKLYEAGNMEG